MTQTALAKPVNTKTDFYRRFQTGEFGNRSETWLTFEDYQKSGYRGKICIRSKKPGGPYLYFVEPQTVIRAIQTFNDSGWHDLSFAAQCPEDDAVLKGEICLSHMGIFLKGSFARFPMREAMRNFAFNIWGLEAELIIKQAMNGSSWDWLQYLLLAYPDHVIEFTSLRYCWGTNPGHNTLFWEVRNY